MAQFDVFEIGGNEWVVDIQSDLIEVAWTVVVVPLVLPDSDVKPLQRLNPSFAIGGERRILAIQLPAVVPRSLLSIRIGTLARYEYEIKAALDFLVSGF